MSHPFSGGKLCFVYHLIHEYFLADLFFEIQDGGDISSKTSVEFKRAV
jgi:hypothetical protein